MMIFRSRASEEFWGLYILKSVGGLWSVRINDAYRALAVREGDVFYWFWIGAHDQYERLINS